jgi:hypothetical protein
MKPKASDDDVLLLDDLQQIVAAATVGSKYILNAPNVKEAPAQHVNRPNIPVPSCYCDERGEIHNLLIGSSSSSSSSTSARSPICTVLPDFIQTRSSRRGGDGKRINILHSKA